MVAGPVPLKVHMWLDEALYISNRTLKLRTDVFAILGASC